MFLYTDVCVEARGQSSALTGEGILGASIKGLSLTRNFANASWWWPACHKSDLLSKFVNFMRIVGTKQRRRKKAKLQTGYLVQELFIPRIKRNLSRTHWPSLDFHKSIGKPSDRARVRVHASLWARIQSFFSSRRYLHFAGTHALIDSLLYLYVYRANCPSALQFI